MRAKTRSVLDFHSAAPKAYSHEVFFKLNFSEKFEKKCLSTSLIIFMNLLKKFAFISIFCISCGGGGGGSDGGDTPQVNPGSSVTSMVFTLEPLSFAVNEDETYEGVLSASSNPVTSFFFQITYQPQNGVVNLNASSGSFTFSPSTDFTGTDEFSFRVYTEGSFSNEELVTVTVNPINDAPQITLTNEDIDKQLLVSDNNKILISALASDIDNEISDLTYSFKVKEITLPITYVSSGGETVPSESESSIEVDISQLEEAGHFDSLVTVCDLDQACTSTSFSTFYVTNLRLLENYRSYNLLGTYDANNLRGTNLLLVADSLQFDRGSFRTAVSESIRNLLIGSEVSNFFKDYFNIFVIEPLNGTVNVSFLNMNLGECSEWSETIFCWDSSKLGTLRDDLFPDVYIDSIAIFSSLDGRGVTRYDNNLPPTTAQHIYDYTYQTFMHEFGHSHALLGDEYLSDDERQRSYYEANYSPNTTTNVDAYSLKWNHWIEDLTNIPGFHPTAGQFGVGLFEGNYYGDTDNYRPKSNTVMNNKSNLRYGEVGSEAFAIVSTQNQFSSYMVDFEVSEDNGTRNSVKISLLGQYDATNSRLEWYENKLKVDSLTDQKEVTFSRPEVDEVTRYTWKVVDLTGVITVPEDPFNFYDSYEGVFDYNSRFYSWDGSSWIGPYYNPDDLSPYDYGLSTDVLGSSLFINWSLWK